MPKSFSGLLFGISTIINSAMLSREKITNEKRVKVSKEVNVGQQNEQKSKLS